MPAQINPKVGIPASERPKPSQVPQGKPYTPESSGDAGWDKLVQTRPFISCADCGEKLAPSAGTVCPVCERQRNHSIASKVPYGPPLPDDEYQDR